jgi:hypothetical protein
MIPVFEHLVYPLIERVKGSKITLTQKVVSGLITAAVGCLTAAALVWLFVPYQKIPHVRQ